MFFPEFQQFSWKRSKSPRFSNFFGFRTENSRILGNMNSEKFLKKLENSQKNRKELKEIRKKNKKINSQQKQLENKLKSQKTVRNKLEKS